MSTEVATKEQDAAALLERVVVGGDLAKLSSVERLGYYRSVCESIGLNPLTKPFEYIQLNGKLTLYARKDCTDQLRKMNAVSIAIVSRERLEDVYVVTARGTLPSGRQDESIGAVAITGKKGDDLANALMKAETKAKRRVTLSVCGLGLLDETEVETIKGAVVGEPGQLQAPAMPSVRETDRPAEETGEVISTKQLNRLWAIARGAGWSGEDVKSLLSRYGVQSPTAVTLFQYDDIINVLKVGPGPRN